VFIFQVFPLDKAPSFVPAPSQRWNRLE